MSIAEERSDLSDAHSIQRTSSIDANHNKGCIYRIRSSFNALNASWAAKWWYSAVHNITAILGAGVLTLPAAMAFLTWAPGIVILALLWLISLMTLWQMIQMHEDNQGNRFDRYYELGQHLLGRRLGLWIIVPLQLLTVLGVDTVYVLTAAKSMHKINEILHGDGHIKVGHWISVFGCIQLLLSQFPQLASLTPISILATFTAIGYSTIAWSTTLYAGIHGKKSDMVRYEFPNLNNTARSVFGIFEAVGQMAFATAGHNVILEIQATMPSTTEVPSKIPMWHGVLVAYVVIALCYFPCASVGYWFYGNQRDHNNLALDLKGSPILIFIVNMLVVLHMFGSYQIYATTLFDQVEIFLNRKFGIKPNFISRIPLRSLYVVFTCFLAWRLPFFGDLQAFFAGFAIVPTTFVLPGILWHFHRKPTAFSPPWLANMVAIVIGSIVTITSSIGAMYNIIVKLKEDKY